MRLFLLLLLAVACGDSSTPQAVAPVQDKCPRIGLHKLAGQWIRVQTSRGDSTHRFEIRADGDGYEGWFIQGGFQRMTMKGVVRKTDVQFTEELFAEAKGAYAQGQRSRRRFFIEPRRKTCSLRMTQVALKMRGGRETDQSRSGLDEYLPFPEGQPFSFRPCDSSLFVGKAAKSKRAADWEQKTHGGAKRSQKLGKKIPLGTWSDAQADGSAECSYQMDLYFDDRPVEGRQDIAAGKVERGQRHWFVPDWYAPYSGNHHFQIYRYRTCEGSDRALIGVACLDAVLHP